VTELTLHADRIVRHSRRFYLRLCAWCDRTLGSASHTSAGIEPCDHAQELLRQARARAKRFRHHPRTPWAAPRGPWFPTVRGEVGLARPNGSPTLARRHAGGPLVA
jgi:hypothetical protein